MGVLRAPGCDPAQVDQWSGDIDATKPVFVYCLKGLDIGRSTALALRARGFDVRRIMRDNTAELLGL